MSSEIIPGAKPTRMELLALERRKTLAERGYDLLREKQEALIMTFFSFIHELQPIRERVERLLSSTYKDFALSQIFLGARKVGEVALNMPEKFGVDVKTRNVIGVTVPLLRLTELKPEERRHRYSLLETSSKLDECISKVEESLRAIVSMAEVESAIRRLAEAIMSTKRRVNALEYIIIPRLVNTIKYIEMHLEEREREDFFRLKMIKRIHEKRAAEATAA